MKVLALSLAMLIANPAWPQTTGQMPQLPDPGSAGGITKQQQEQIGLQAMAQVYQQMPVLPDSNPVTQYVQQLGKKLVAVIPQQNSWPYQFHVVQEKDINAFALPGGPLFINIGTVLSADNEAELAGVMAHEMSHVYMQHSAKQASKQSFEQGLLGVLGGLIPNGTVGTLAKVGIQVGAGIVSLKYSRGDEAQADAVGAIIMYKAGYDPHAMAQFFQKLEQQGGGGAPQFLSDHPNPGNRVAAVDKEIQNWPPETYHDNSQTFVTAKQQATGVKAYTAQEIAQGAKQGTWAQQNKQSGATPANLPAPPTGANAGAANGNLANVTLQQVKPSRNFTQLQQNGFTISYPQNWQAAADQNGGATIAPAAGVSQGTIAYGASINLAQDANASSLDQATQDLISSLQQNNPGMQISGGLKSVTVNGIKGRSADLLSASPVQKNGQPEQEHDWLVTLPRPQGGLLYMIFISPQSSFSQLRPSYKRMLQSLRLQ